MLRRFGILLGAALFACGEPDPILPANTAAIWLSDFGSKVGLNVRHTQGINGSLYMPEMTGAGAALFDADLDGDLDIWLVDGHTLPERAPGDPSDRLMRNLLVEQGELRFEDASREFGVRAEGYGMGIAVGDVNNDGFPDVYLAQLGANQLWINREGKRFEERTAEAGLADSGVWSTGATFVDLDQDGFLDLYVLNYVDFTFDNHKTCRKPSGRPDYCGPTSYQPLHDSVYRNLGNGAFEDVTRRTGVDRFPASGLAVVSGDFNNDGRTDLYVANDMMPNFLWSVTNEGVFENHALSSGAAVNDLGKAEASMGISVGDIDGNGWEDLLVTHLDRETDTLYLADGTGGFVDRTTAYRLSQATLASTGFGTAFADFDLDGRLDLVVANGSVTQVGEQVERGVRYPLGQPNQLFRLEISDHDARFVDYSAHVDPSFRALEVSRGLCVGDVDENGAPDVLITNNGGLPRLYLNRLLPAASDWLGVRVLDERWNRPALGARVTVRTADGEVQMRTVRSDGSFASAGDPRVLFGLKGHEVKELEVRWLDGNVVTLAAPAIGRYLTVQRSGLVPNP